MARKKKPKVAKFAQGDVVWDKVNPGPTNADNGFNPLPAIGSAVSAVGNAWQRGADSYGASMQQPPKQGVPAVSASPEFKQRMQDFNNPPQQGVRGVIGQGQTGGYTPQSVGPLYPANAGPQPQSGGGLPTTATMQGDFSAPLKAGWNAVTGGMNSLGRSMDTLGQQNQRFLDSKTAAAAGTYRDESGWDPKQSAPFAKATGGGASQSISGSGGATGGGASQSISGSGGATYRENGQLSNFSDPTRRSLPATTYSYYPNTSTIGDMFSQPAPALGEIDTRHFDGELSSIRGINPDGTQSYVGKFKPGTSDGLMRQLIAERDQKQWQAAEKAKADPANQLQAKVDALISKLPPVPSPMSIDEMKTAYPRNAKLGTQALTASKQAYVSALNARNAQIANIINTVYGGDYANQKTVLAGQTPSALAEARYRDTTGPATARLHNAQADAAIAGIQPKEQKVLDNDFKMVTSALEHMANLSPDSPAYKAAQDQYNRANRNIQRYYVQQTDEYKGAKDDAVRKQIMARYGFNEGGVIGETPEARYNMIGFSAGDQVAIPPGMMPNMNQFNPQPQMQAQHQMANAEYMNYATDMARMGVNPIAPEQFLALKAMNNRAGFWRGGPIQLPPPDQPPPTTGTRGYGFNAGGPTSQPQQAVPVQGQELMGVGPAAGGPKADTIPAVIDGSTPAALSTGEFVYTAASTDAVGSQAHRLVMQALERGDPAVVSGFMALASKAAVQPKQQAQATQGA